MNGRTHSIGRAVGDDGQTPSKRPVRQRRSRVVAAAALVVSFSALIDHASTGLSATSAAPIVAVLPTLAGSTQFDITGFVDTAALDPACAASAHCGGTMTINGHAIVVPSETIVILPASALTWQELFALAPAPYGPSQTGMALKDTPTPLTTYEVHVVGNRVIAGGQDRYIAGLVHVSQQELNTGAGYINFMDYALGEMRVGGVMNDPNCVANAANTVAGGVACSGARVQIDDPTITTAGDIALGTGRYGRAKSPDMRFQVDQDSPTIASATGFPMCFPRSTTDPNAGGADDAQCPRTNRPVDPTTNTFTQLFTMSNPAPVGSPDAHLQAPFEVGDYVTFAGTLIANNPIAPNPAATFISAHTIIDNTAIFTPPGTDPAYVSIEVSLMGTGGLTVFGAGEASIRTRFEGMSTDSTRPIYVYGIDYKADGTTTPDRYFGTIMPDPGTPIGAVKGRWRFRPPCAPFGTVVAKPDRQCLNSAANGYLPPPREIRAVIAAAGNDAYTGVAPLPTNPTFTKSANGLSYGQYHAPIGDYIFPENTPGNPIVENNFNTMPFLALGGYSSITGVVAGQLNPWPSNVLPCIAPIANPGGPYAVVSGRTVNLAASATGSPTMTFAWAAAASGTLSSTTVANPVFTAAVLPVAQITNTVVALSVTVTNGCGTSTVPVPVTVTPIQPPVVTAVPARSSAPNTTGTIALTGTDPNAPALTPLTFTVTQSPLGALNPLTVTQNPPAGATVSYTTPATAGTITLTITATNAAGKVSSPVTTTINVTSAATLPTANAGGPYTVTLGSQIALAGSATGSPTPTVLWTVPSTAGSLSKTTIANPVFTANGTGTFNVTFAATNSAGTTTATSTITVLAKVAPVTNPITPISVFAGSTGNKLSITGSDPNIPAQVPLVFNFAGQTGSVVLNNRGFTTGTTTGNTTSGVWNFDAPTLPANTVTPVLVTVTFNVQNKFGLRSANVSTTISVVPLPDTVTITNATYRISDQRLILAATSNVISADLVLKLQPYLTTLGTIFDPTTLGSTFTNGGLGTYNITLVGAPEPAIPPATPLTVKSSLNGLSAPHGLDLIRLN